MKGIAIFPDDEVVKKLNERDTHAYSSLFSHFYPALCYFIENKIHDKELAQDIVSDLFARIWDRKEQFENARHLKNFLYRSAYNALLNHIKLADRSAKRLQIVAQDQDDHEQHHLNAMIRSEVLREMMAAIEQLPVRQAQVIDLCFLEGLDNHAIARRLNISEKTVRNMKSEALAQLRQNLHPASFEWLMLLPFLLALGLQTTI